MTEEIDEARLEPADIESWAAFLPAVRVGGALPVTFRADGEYMIVEVVVPYVPPPERELPANATKIPLRIAEGFPVPLVGRHRLPPFSPAGAAAFLRDIVREIYHHEIDEQLRIGGDRPFAPDHGD